MNYIPYSAQQAKEDLTPEKRKEKREKRKEKRGRGRGRENV